MAKTQATLDLENALAAYSRKKREYGCKEVTIGFHHDGHGDEIVDFMTMDANAVFRCYELKVSLSDLKTGNKKSFYGDYNYLVVSESLYRKNPVWENWIPPYCGILCGTALRQVRNAKKRSMDEPTREMMKNSLIRTLYWKMISYEDADALASSRSLQKQYEEEREALEEKIREGELKTWTYDDYEHYYRLNHQDSSFTIAHAAKEERRQYMLRKENKLISENTCPGCGHKVNDSDRYCRWCGLDLRRMG